MGGGRLSPCACHVHDAASDAALRIRCLAACVSACVSACAPLTRSCTPAHRHTGMPGHRGSELLREVAWVVFDEVHYMQVRAGVCATPNNAQWGGVLGFRCGCARL